LWELDAEAFSRHDGLQTNRQRSEKVVRIEVLTDRAIDAQDGFALLVETT
jgi:hypothetical protein